MNPKRKKHKQVARRRTRRTTPLRIVGWATLIAFVGFAAFLTIDLVRSQTGDNSQVKQQAAPPVATRTGATPEPYGGGGRLWLPVTEIDLGKVPLMQEVSRSFDLQNVGDAPLIISEPTVKVLQGCWPFQPVVGSTTVKPGEKTTLSFTTHMMEGMDGPHLFEITVQTNDPVEPVQKLQVKAVFG